MLLRRGDQSMLNGLLSLYSVKRRRQQADVKGAAYVRTLVNSPLEEFCEHVEQMTVGEAYYPVMRVCNSIPLTTHRQTGTSSCGGE